MVWRGGSANAPRLVDRGRHGEVPFFASGKTITYLPPPAGYTAAFPAAVSDDGVVVGHAGKPAPPGRVPLRNQAFVWDAKTGMHGLGVLADDVVSYARDISADSRRISGYSVGTNRVRACIWDRDGAGWNVLLRDRDQRSRLGGRSSRRRG